MSTYPNGPDHEFIMILRHADADADGGICLRDLGGKVAWAGASRFVFYAIRKNYAISHSLEVRHMT